MSDNSEWYRSRLDEPALLDAAILIENTGLAVPVGGTRRAGCLPVEDEQHAAETIKALEGREGFPNLRFVAADDPEDTYDNVCWGADEAALPDWEAPDVDWARNVVEAGRLYGYREDVIREFVSQQWGADLADEALGAPTEGPTT